MRPANVFQIELASVLARKRNLVLRLGVTFLLGLPFVVIAMPLSIRVSGLQMLLIFSGFFGASVSFVRRKNEGHYGRLKLLPIPTRGILADFLLAGALVDILQIGSILLLFIFIHGVDITHGLLIKTFGFFIVAVLMLNFLGMLLGSFMKSNPEVHLFGALAAGFIAFISGLLPAPSAVRGGIESLGQWNPVSRLGHSLQEITMGLEVNDGAIMAAVLILISFTGLLLIRFVDWDKISVFKGVEKNKNLSR